MGREHQLDRQSIEDLLHPLGRHAAAGKFGEAGRNRLRDRGRIALPFALPQHAHPLPILGNVGQVEKDAERSRHGPGLAVAEPGNHGGQLALGPITLNTVAMGPMPWGAVILLAVVARSPLAGQQADAFHQVEGRGTVEAGDYRAQQVTQQMNVAAEQVVADHGSGHSLTGRVGGQVGAGRRTLRFLCGGRHHIDYGAKGGGR